MFKYSFLFLYGITSLFGSDTFYYQNNQKIELIKLTDGDLLTTHYYKTPQGKIVGIGDEIIVKLKNDTSIENLSLKYDLIYIEKIADMLYLLKVKNNAKTLEIANLISSENDVASSYPNFIKIIQKR